ncbi:MarR family transcriptional regulator [Gammaproteobacteria bacterium]
MPRLSNRQISLKPQDLYLLLALAACRDQGTTYPELAVFVGLSMSEVHGALKRIEMARLLMFEGRRPTILVPAFKEFLFHGAKYAFPAVRGSMVAGVPTAHAAPPLNALIAPSADPAPVWPFLEGSMRGVALIPLYPSVPAAALRNAALHENLALFDAIRAGNAREHVLAQRLFEERL